MQTQSLPSPNSSLMARSVSFSASRPLYMAARIRSNRSGGSEVRGIRFATSIFGSVMVPVLSTHSTSTRASDSMQFISCTSTFRFDSFSAEAAMATLVSRYSPSGIIPTSAETVPSVLSRIPRWSTAYS